MLSLTDPVALFHEIGWLCHRRIFKSFTSPCFNPTPNSNNAIERLSREIKRRTKVIGAFPDGQSALILVCARLRHVVATSWGARRYMNMDHLFKTEEDLLSDIIAG